VVASPGIQPEDDKEDEERRDSVPAQETFVTLGPVEQPRGEEPMLVDARKLQVVRDGRRPQQVRGDNPCGRGREDRDDPERGSQAATAASTGAAGASGSASAGPLNGYLSVRSQKYALLCRL
jgi:hypothetical protein